MNYPLLTTTNFLAKDINRSDNILLMKGLKGEKMEDVSNKTLFILIILSILVTLIGTAYTVTQAFALGGTGDAVSTSQSAGRDSVVHRPADFVTEGHVALEVLPQGGAP